MMTRLLITVASVLSFCCVVLASDSPSLQERLDPIKPPQYDAFQNQAAEFGDAELSGRGLINLWMGKRQLTCSQSNYALCSNEPFCCPVGDGCCPFGCCKATQTCCGGRWCLDPGATCCTFGTCPAGYDCCLNSCIPKGGECCDDGNYCPAGNHCYLVYGKISCCTDSRCTAYVSGGVTSTLAGSQPTQTQVAPPVTTTRATTTPPEPVPTKAPSIWYTYTITWYYIQYYWSLETLELTTMAFTAHSDITLTTTISIYESNSDSAYQSFLASSSAIVISTPAGATSLPPLSDVLPSPTTTPEPTTSAAPKTPSTSSSSHTTTSTTSKKSSTTTSDIGSAATGSSTGSPTLSRAATQYPRIGWGLESLFLALGIGAGVLMVWL